jgi:hypothetical protein
MKVCSVCGVEKPAEDFQVRRASADGRTAACRVCLAARDKARDKDPARIAAKAAYIKTPAGAAAAARAKAKYASSKHGREARRESVRRWRNKKPSARRAHTAVERAVKSGRLVPWPCEVCGSKAHAHHPDYSMPLVVVWLCPSHHKEAHALIGTEPETTN